MTRVAIDPQTTGIVIEAIARGPQGWSKLEALVDPGASFCIIPTEIMVLLGYDLNRPDELKRVAGVTSHWLPLFNVASFEALGHKVEPCWAGAFDLPDEAPVNALLGLSFLRHFRLTIDLPRGLLELAASEPITPGD